MRAAMRTRRITCGVCVSGVIGSELPPVKDGKDVMAAGAESMQVQFSYQWTPREVMGVRW